MLCWLRDNRSNVTTARIINALNITDLPTQRHLSRRFSLLEDKGVLSCTLQGTTRICEVAKDPPDTLHKPKGRQYWLTIVPERASEPVSPAPATSISATTSEEFLAAGGRIERLPSHWDKTAPQNAVGIHTLLDLISTLD